MLFFYVSNPNSSKLVLQIVFSNYKFGKIIPYRINANVQTILQLVLFYTF